MRLIALDTFDERREGDEFECPDFQARQLISKGLAKLGPIPKNKMAPPTENKTSPSRAVGAALSSFASPAAPALPQTTPNASASGRPRGRPRKTGA